MKNTLKKKSYTTQMYKKIQTQCDALEKVEGME